MKSPNLTLPRNYNGYKPCHPDRGGSPLTVGEIYGPAEVGSLPHPRLIRYTPPFLYDTTHLHLFHTDGSRTMAGADVGRSSPRTSQTMPRISSADSVVAAGEGVSVVDDNEVDIFRGMGQDRAAIEQVTTARAAYTIVSIHAATDLHMWLPC